ncbi:MAG TPA: MoaD/ThiS family protein [Gemmatimonadales bacterium]|nr:MoaD/ThiS family protein [Gemmatimonadales bacterium]
MAQVTVRFFARYAELTGCESAAVRVPDNSATVRDVLERVRETVPGARSLPARPLAALNLRQVKLDARVSDGDEVALLPPLSGG